MKWHNGKKSFHLKLYNVLSNKPSRGHRRVRNLAISSLCAPVGACFSYIQISVISMLHDQSSFILKELHFFLPTHPGSYIYKHLKATTDY